MQVILDGSYSSRKWRLSVLGSNCGGGNRKNRQSQSGAQQPHDTLVKLLGDRHQIPERGQREKERNRKERRAVEKRVTRKKEKEGGKGETGREEQVKTVGERRRETKRKGKWT